MVTLIL